MQSFAKLPAMLVRYEPTPSPNPASAPPGSGLDWWQIVVAAGVVVGLVVGIVQVVFWVQDRRTRREQQRLFEIIGNQLNAERARVEAVQSTALVAELRAQIERDLPAEARRVHLSERLQSLARSITADFEEYQQIEKEMAQTASASPLHEQVRSVVEQAILPARQMDRRRDRFVLIMLDLLAASTLQLRLIEL
ncbi:hypothetical protein Dvina_30475 [Dactylosporangium vinaceum]|uniref:Uncharacterized protein n=1 Tax=Dactylosporangium vinaceum TaxID=53362 RepID=A0ABV5MJN8_9ACTN|nr:hypothetical protein [Dactylosporangium vinaceum]UAB92654.1 hypothetical protein Dvina_30475 [Dactylosporangium vinaceum]